jgi:hypothetical protein
MDRQANNTSLIIIVVSLVVCLCVCALTLGAGALVFVPLRTALNDVQTQVVAITEVFNPPTEPPDEPTDVPVIVTEPVPTPLPGSAETVDLLNNAVIPQRDLRLLAMRFKGISDIPEVVSETPADYPLGTVLEFTATNTDSDDDFTVSAELLYKTDNVYFFAEQGVEVNQGDVRQMVDEFQSQAYPTNREFFGSEWSPGIDGDPRLFILYARGLGDSIAGYYSSADEYVKAARPDSNEKEMFYINADGQVPGDSFLDGVLAHEFQHMIHWYHDRNEDSWMNEGSSELASFLNGYGAGFEEEYTFDTDLQLNTWGEDARPHYGAAFLFMAYFLDRFGEEATKALVSDPANGMQAVDAVLAQLGITDPASGQPVTSADVFGDWVIANYLGDPDVGDGRYAYHNYPDSPTVEFPADSFSDCPIDYSATVTQYGADYYEINCDGPVTINFTGSRSVPVVEAMPNSGRYMFWSNRGDDSDMRLVREFDFTGLTAVTLNFSAWWEIEEDWDYTYLVVSKDGGSTWEMIETPSGTDTNPVGNNLGWGYTGNSGGGSDGEWIQESVDLSAYAGQKVLVAFEYVTDDALNLSGFAVDDLSVPELDYSTDFEADDASWTAEGFVRMDNLLPQGFVVQVIDTSGGTTVQRVALDEANQGSVTMDGRAVLVVSGIAPVTEQKASYEFTIE